MGKPTVAIEDYSSTYSAFSFSSSSSSSSSSLALSSSYSSTGGAVVANYGDRSNDDNDKRSDVVVGILPSPVYDDTSEVVVAAAAAAVVTTTPTNTTAVVNDARFHRPRGRNGSIFSSFRRKSVRKLDPLTSRCLEETNKLKESERTKELLRRQRAQRAATTRQIESLVEKFRLPANEKEEYYCVVLENSLNFNLILPQSNFNLRFLHCTKNLKITRRVQTTTTTTTAAATAVDAKIQQSLLPKDCTLIKDSPCPFVDGYALRIYEIPQSPYRCVDARDERSLSDDEYILRLIYTYKVVYFRNVGIDSSTASYPFSSSFHSSHDSILKCLRRIKDFVTL